MAEGDPGNRTPQDEPTFRLRLADLGGPVWWVNEDMLGEARKKLNQGEFLGVFTARGWVVRDEQSGETHLAELSEGGGKCLDMEDLLPGTWELGGEVEIEITVRARELESTSEEETPDIYDLTDPFPEA